MKVIREFLTLLAVALLPGCALAGNGMVLNTVGPAPSRIAAPAPSGGTLVVFSACDVNADFNSRDPNRPEYSDYCVFDAGGKLLQRVHNDSGTILQDPASVSLSAGTYHVVARANGYGFVTVPVVIENGRSTVLHLEGGGARWQEPAVSADESVRLPDGEIVGWKAGL